MLENDISGGSDMDSLHGDQTSMFHGGISLKMVSSVVWIWI